MGWGKFCSIKCRNIDYRGSLKGKNNPFFGKTHSEEFKIKQKLRYLGISRKPHTEETKQKISFKNTGRKRNEETKYKISKALENRVVTEKTRKKMSEAHSGSKTNFWKGGIDKKEYKHYQNLDYRLWREKVFKRDEYICQKCNLSSGNGSKVFLIPHHIKSYTHYPELRYKISNGLTLCQNCHNNYHWRKEV